MADIQEQATEVTEAAETEAAVDNQEAEQTEQVTEEERVEEPAATAVEDKVADTDWSAIFASLYDDDDNEDDNEDDKGGDNVGDNTSDKASDNASDNVSTEENGSQQEETNDNETNEENIPVQVQTAPITEQTIPDEVQKQLDGILAELHSLNPAINKFSDLEDVELFAAFIDRGYSTEDALLQSSPKYSQQAHRQDNRYAIAQSKSHLTATATDKYANDIDTDVIAICMNAGLTKEEAIKYYKSVTNR